METYLSVWRNAFVLNGRARRTEYWLFGLINILMLIALIFVACIVASLADPGLQAKIAVIVLALGLWSIAAMVPSVTVTVRRFHDAGISARWLVYGYLVMTLVQLLVAVAQFAAPALVESYRIEATWGILLASILVGGFFLVVMLLPSQAHENRWGQNPKALKPAVDDTAVAQ